MSFVIDQVSCTTLSKTIVKHRFYEKTLLGCKVDPYAHPVTSQKASRHCLGIFQDCHVQGARDMGNHTKLVFPLLVEIKVLNLVSSVMSTEIH